MGKRLVDIYQTTNQIDGKSIPIKKLKTFKINQENSQTDTTIVKQIQKLGELQKVVEFV